MRKKEFIASIGEKTNIPQPEVLLVIETMIQVIKDTLVNQESIYIRGFCTFQIRKRAAKTGRNIKKGSTVYIPEHLIPIFRPSRKLVHEIGKKLND